MEPRPLQHHAVPPPAQSRHGLYPLLRDHGVDLAFVAVVSLLGLILIHLGLWASELWPGWRTVGLISGMSQLVVVGWIVRICAPQWIRVLWGADHASRR